MKILISAYACNPYSGSELGNGFNWAYYSASSQNQVYCLTQLKYKDDIERFLLTNPKLNLNFIYVAVPAFVNKIYKFQFGVYVNYLTWQYYASKKAAEIDKKFHLDILHHVTWGNLILGTFLWRLKKPLIFGPAGGGQRAPIKFKKYFYKWWKQEIVRNQIQSFLLALKIPHKTVKNAQVILVSNPDTYDIAKEMGAKNVLYSVDTGLPDDFYPKEFPIRKINSSLKILWVGRFFAFKGLPLVLESLSRVHKDTPFSLTILGDGPLAPMIPKLIEDLGLKEKVSWKGKVPWEQVKEAYLTHDVFMFCSLRDSFASQFLEAMAYGLPILTLNLNGAGKLIPDDAAIKVIADFPENTVKNLAKSVEWMYNNRAECMEMGKKGYEFAKTQVWPNKTAEALKFYEEMIGEVHLNIS